MHQKRLIPPAQVPMVCIMSETHPMELHASLVDCHGRGILLRGPPGAGKSDLALRLIEAGARLVADDRVQLRRGGNGIVGRAPDTLAGLLEVRGIGILRLDHQAETRLALIVDLVAPDAVPRLPEPAQESILGVAIPLLAMAAFHASTPAALKLAVVARSFAGALGDAA